MISLVKERAERYQEAKEIGPHGCVCLKSLA